ncbi:MAG: DUF3536 domain-containing protein [Synergistaceae bacterium]|nr:DUF3536 domain-containing protein [Synergistaceae bacterium]
MPRYICIHGHFYQPPRENPWLETVELQESAAPWHDWNARISAECYSRNAASRILNEQGYIRKICNNYSRMSFNIGPTLLTWLEENDPLCYSAILEADKLGRRRFSGHGPAMAQVYNHIIMPLASRRDKETQVKWGIADFKKRYGRMPEGMWLAECAVDTETLEVLAENGIDFTVLSPYQAQSVRVKGWGDWEDVSGGKVDTRCAYVCNLPSGRKINLFFYDGDLSQKIAFGGLLDDGGNFARELITAHPAHGKPVLCHVATDGESYGHHHKHGDMALAYCLECLEHTSGAQLTVYGEYLEFYPPECEAKIVENSSWSCAHGVERWRSNCSCGDGTPGYHHKWREPLRNAMNYLRDELAKIYEGNNLLVDAWEARDKYIRVILDRSDENVDAFLSEHTDHTLTPEERVRALMFLEMERNALLMFTSCGWFFDEISRIEPVQIMRYAARAIELARILTGEDLEPAFMKLLAEAPSNVPELQDGAKIYELRAKLGRADRKQMAAYYGITSLFEDFRDSFSEGCWDMSGNALNVKAEGEESSFSAGKVHVRSRITGIEGDYLFAVNINHSGEGGGALISCGICETNPDEEIMPDEVMELQAMFESDEREKLLFGKFGYDQFTLNNIPSNSRYRIINALLKQDMHSLEEALASKVKNYDQLLEYLTLLGSKPPAILTVAAEFTLTSEIVKRLEDHYPDLEGIRRGFELAGFWRVEPDEERIRFAFSDCINEILTGLCMGGLNMQAVEDLNELVKLFTEKFEWHLSLYDSQNLYHELLKKYGDDLRNEPERMRSALYELGHALKFSDEMLGVLRH